MKWPTPEEDEASDFSHMMTEGYHRGQNPAPLTEDDLIPIPPRLRRAFLNGFEAAREQRSGTT